MNSVVEPAASHSHEMKQGSGRPVGWCGEFPGWNEVWSKPKKIGRRDRFLHQSMQHKEFNDAVIVVVP